MSFLSKNVIMIIIMTVFVTPVYSQIFFSSNDADKYNQAGALYQDGKYPESLEIYESLIESGIENPDLYYNASNAAYRTGMLGLAILYIERALRLDPSDEDALANRDFLNSIKQDYDDLNENVVLSFLRRSYDRINLNTAALLSAVTFTLCMIFATVWLFVKNRLKIAALVSLCLTVIVCIVVTGLFVHKLNHLSTVEEAIVMISEVRAYSGPGTENTHIFTIHEGTKVVVERQQGNWQLVRLNSGAGGWINADAIVLVSLPE